MTLRVPLTRIGKAMSKLALGDQYETSTGCVAIHSPSSPKHGTVQHKLCGACGAALFQLPAIVCGRHARLSTPEQAFGQGRLDGVSYDLAKIQKRIHRSNEPTDLCHIHRGTCCSCCTLLLRSLGFEYFSKRSIRSPTCMRKQKNCSSHCQEAGTNLASQPNSPSCMSLPISSHTVSTSRPPPDTTKHSGREDF
jgi:hypothetical protein